MNTINMMKSAYPLYGLINIVYVLLIINYDK